MLRMFRIASIFMQDVGFHGSCVGIHKRHLSQMSTWLCTLCEAAAISKRRRQIKFTDLYGLASSPVDFVTQECQRLRSILDAFALSVASFEHALMIQQLELKSIRFLLRQLDAMPIGLDTFRNLVFDHLLKLRLASTTI